MFSMAASAACLFTTSKTARAVIRSPQTLPPLLTGLNTQPLVNPAAVIQRSTAALAKDGIGTDRTRPPLPVMSTITQRPSRYWMCSSVRDAASSPRSPVPMSRAKQSMIPLASQSRNIRRVDERLRLRDGEPVSGAVSVPFYAPHAANARRKLRHE
jgi:hypothetical protein